MSRLGLIFLLACALPGLLLAQGDIRNPTVDGQTAEGALITQAGIADDPAEKIKFLETFVEKFSTNVAIGYVYFQLETLYLGQENYDKTVEYGEKLLKIVPNDLEVRHNLIKGYEGKGDYAALLTMLTETKPLADKVVAGPKPSNLGDGEWKTQVEYAEGVVQYLEYSLYTSLFKITDGATKVKYVEALRALYPEGQYTKQSGEQLVAAYQALGDYPKMFDAMRQSLEANPNNEGFLYTLAEQHTRNNELDQGKKYADQLLKVIEQKAKPEGVPDANWAAQKALFTALGNFVLGRILTIQEKYREGRTLLLKSVDPIKAQGGENYGVLGYFLGICFVKLDVGGDNLVAARNWMTVAANTPSGYQAEAKNILSKLPKVAQ
jgi:tetratricopeptide (TPR) repeat protein